MADPASELATWRWLKERSALSELLEVDFEAIGLHRLYGVSDLLVRHRQEIEQALFARIDDLFHQVDTVACAAMKPLGTRPLCGAPIPC